MSNMVIRTNVLALNSHRNLGMTGRQQANASARLSSGYRINSAADDAAGLGISEKMRAQIRGLDQASRNAQDGISLIQTAEGAMSTIGDMVSRIRELVVQASNDTNAHDDSNLAQSDRARIQEEINQLMDEIDKTRERTQFNTRNLIDGSLGSGGIFGSGKGGPIKSIDAISNVTLDDLINLFSGGQNGNTADVNGTLSGAQTVGDYNWIDGANDGEKSKAKLASIFLQAFADTIGVDYNSLFDNANSTVDGAVASWLSSLNLGGTYGSLEDIAIMSGSSADKQLVGAALLDIFNKMDVQGAVRDDTPPNRMFTAGGNVLSLSDNMITNGAISLRDRQAAEDAARGALATWISNNRTELGITGPSTVSGLIAAFQDPKFLASGGTNGLNDLYGLFFDKEVKFTEAGMKLRDSLEAAINGAIGRFATGGGGGGGGLYFQVGANAGQGVRLSIEDVGTAALSEAGYSGSGGSAIRPGFSFAELRTRSEQSGVTVGNGVELTDGARISEFLTAIDRAYSHVSSQRSNLGAMQNRLEYTMENLDISSENLSASESRIRDADMAKEMMRMTQSNVLQQAATAMLAQANQAPQSVLQLLG